MATTIELTGLIDKIEELEKEIQSQVKEVVVSTLKNIFDGDDTIRDISWAQKYSEYDDEGLYPGVSPVLINQFIDEKGDRIESEDWIGDPFYYGSPPSSYSDARKKLDELFSKLGPERLAGVIGYDECVVIAWIKNERIMFTTEQAGY